jgi:predicted RNA binding protein YcfA (HicA-like mRNA interferase family)
MTANEVIRILRRAGCSERQGKGSHIIFWSPTRHCTTVVSNHRGDVPKGTLKAIEADMEHCLGKGWLK